MTKRVLIFPGGMPRALDYLQKCLREGNAVVGASSLGYDPSRQRYPAWTQLPFVTDTKFDHSLKHVLTELAIDEIYTPNIVVWNHLRKVLGRISPKVVLANPSPVDEVLEGYRIARTKAQHLASYPLSLESCLPARPSLSEVELAALIRYTDMIPGMCDDDKFLALLEIARRTVTGDIVEIGSWWGKSAFVLARLARCFDIGKLLCIDPWANEHLLQGEAIVDSGSAQVDAEEALAVFQIGLLPFDTGHINYLRETSVHAAVHYKHERSVSTEVFGRTEYSGHISVLHIDGNHAYEAVKADVELWTPLVVSGGWIIVDDYVWPYGDGPKRVADEFLSNHFHRISSAFIMGAALFLQVRQSLV